MNIKNIKDFLDNISGRIKSIYNKSFDYIEKFAHSRYKLHALFVMSFLEQSVSPLPPDMLVMPIAMYKKYSAFFVANFAAISGAIGGIFTYIICAHIGEGIIDYFDLGSYLEPFKHIYYNNLFITTVIVGFTPIPDKIFTIFGGIFKVSFLPLILGLYVGKFLRYYIVAALAERYGIKAKEYLSKYIDKVTYFITLLFLIYIIYIYYK